MSAATPDYPLDDFDRITSDIPMLSPFRALWNEAEELLQALHPEGFEAAEIGRLAFEELPEAEREAAMRELFYAYWERIVDDREAKAADPCHPCGCPKRFDRHAWGCPTQAGGAS